MSMLAEQLEPRAADATRQLFESHRRRIFGFCLSQLGNHHDAEDAVQTTFLYAFGCLERGVVPEAELAWLFKIALNVCRTRRRSLGRRRRIEAPTDLDSCEYAMAAPERADDDLLGLSGALAAMPANQRNALLLREWQGLSYAEIADRLTISHSAVETLLFRARRTLASQLRRIPQQVAVFANVPLLLRMVRRLSPGTTALKTTAAVVAIGAVTSVSGQELTPRHAGPAARPARSTPHNNAAPPSSVARPVSHRLVAKADAPRVARLGSTGVASPVSTPAQAPPTPTVSSSPESPQQDQPVPPPGPAAAAPTTVPPPTTPTPTVPVEPPIPVGELSGDVTTAATDLVQTVASQVPPITTPATDAVAAVAATATTVVSSVTQTVGVTIPTHLLPKP